VIAIEHEGMKMSSSENCQYLCFQDHSCKNFTFFANEAGMRCILFRGCHSTMPCNKCLTGPSDPPINQCTNVQKTAALNRIGGEVDKSNLNSDPEITTFRPAFRLPNQLPRQPKQFNPDNEVNAIKFCEMEFQLLF